MGLQEYHKKRDFKKTREPKGKNITTGKNIFVVQKHHASHLHYDFRLEVDGVLKSWAVPKGPSLDAKQKRLAVEVEDHPIEYATFEGDIPKGEYGAGHVIVWDYGTWQPIGDPSQQIKKGRLEFELYGEKLKGKWILVRTGMRAKGKKHNWLLIKRSDGYASKQDVTKQAESVLSETQTTTANKDLKFIAPQLATLTTTVPKGTDWLHEVKFDGYRTIASIENKTVRLLTRNGLDWTHKYSYIAQELKKLSLGSVILDGEIVWVNKKGITDFSGLQEAIQENKSHEMQYCVFDIMHLDGEDIRELPLALRKEILRETIRPLKSKAITFSEHVLEEGKLVLQSACQSGLEGIISKNINSTYESTRSKMWLKSKCKNVQEFVVGGFTYQKESDFSIGALLVGVYQNDKLQYVGRVGTGFNKSNSSQLLKTLGKYKVDSSQFDIKSPRSASIHWVKPKLVINVEFGSWTADHILRHAVFKGVRQDKKAQAVSMDVKIVTPKNSATVKISHPNKILFSKSKHTKQDLVDYYELVKQWMLPHIVQRPLSLLRCPNGEAKTCFFQKHLESKSDFIFDEAVHSKLKGKKEKIIFIDSLEGVQSLVQLNVLELHARGCKKDAIDYPDQIVFDLDPDPGVQWGAVKQAAKQLKDLLQQLNLKSFFNVSGGKGLHLHVPIAPKYDWDIIKAFARTVCARLVEMYPDKYTINVLKKNRKGKIFLDYLRNGYGATAIVPYSVRAKPNASIALPIRWEELRTLKAPDTYTMDNIKTMLKKRHNDPWQDFFKLQQSIAILENHSAR